MYAQDLSTVSRSTATVTSRAALANYRVENTIRSTCPLARLNRARGGRAEVSEGDLS
jgi:hypothetical protein